MKNSSKALLALVLVAGSVVPALAGVKNTFPVGVNTTSRYAMGAFGTARNSADTRQQLSCFTVGYSTTQLYGGSGGCSATDAAGNSAYCYFYNPDLIAIVQSIPSDAFVYFTWDSTGKCSTIQVSTDSSFEPKK